MALLNWAAGTGVGVCWGLSLSASLIILGLKLEGRGGFAQLSCAQAFAPFWAFELSAAQAARRGKQSVPLSCLVLSWDRSDRGSLHCRVSMAVPLTNPQVWCCSVSTVLRP